jgi:hypothetical protein
MAGIWLCWPYIFFLLAHSTDPCRSAPWTTWSRKCSTIRLSNTSNRSNLHIILKYVRTYVWISGGKF